MPGGRRGYVVQAVGGWLAFEPASWCGDEEPVTQLVAIGTGMDDAAVEAALRGCLDEPGSIPADHLHALTRYLR
ncbi:GTP-binding protein [Mobilicoccus pelagius]|uniref:CobW C-terminal domain-containing protein n=1 Tax=Mobilicoccus pelagius NBRC 104925 TaxID=1089455 RepID=H5UQN0_9MICO|nr:GTP-binding protein [Mobilicoccus pelagius]GAB48038.1 hypothetical protein MOPEL_036_00020 [Mobilicoccus pelagius NBRC 104925]